MSLRSEIERLITTEASKGQIAVGNGMVGTDQSDPREEIRQLRVEMRAAIAATLQPADEVERLTRA